MFGGFHSCTYSPWLCYLPCLRKQHGLKQLAMQHRLDGSYRVQISLILVRFTNATPSSQCLPVFPGTEAGIASNDHHPTVFFTFFTSASVTPVSVLITPSPASISSPCRPHPSPSASFEHGCDPITSHFSQLAVASLAPLPD